jgi:hypothetical protein
VDDDYYAVALNPVEVEPINTAHVIAFALASALLLSVVIFLVEAYGRFRVAKSRPALVTAFAVCAVSILFATYGDSMGFSPVVYILIPVLAIASVPPVVFSWGVWRVLAYLVLMRLSAGLLHTAFFNGLGWSDFLPVLRLSA